MTANKVYIEYFFITKCRFVQGGVVEVVPCATQICPAVSIHTMRVICRTGNWNTLWSNIQLHKFWSFSGFTSFTLHIIVLFLINSCLWLSTYECCKITRLCSVYTLGIVHVCLGICLLAACTNKTKKSLLSQNKLPLDMSKKLYLPHPSSVQSSVLPASLALPLFGATRKKLPTQLNPLITPSRAAMEDFLQASLPQWQLYHLRTVTATTTFFYTKSRQDLGLTSVASWGSPTILCCAFFSRTWQKCASASIHA